MHRVRVCVGVIQSLHGLGKFRIHKFGSSLTLPGNKRVMCFHARGEETWLLFICVLSLSIRFCVIFLRNLKSRS